MTTFTLHWRSLITPAEGRSATPYADRDAIHRICGDLNRAQAGCFHWWFVENEPDAEPEPEGAPIEQTKA